jgi:hypothetical protein
MHERQLGVNPYATNGCPAFGAIRRSCGLSCGEPATALPDLTGVSRRRTRDNPREYSWVRLGPDRARGRARPAQ